MQKNILETDIKGEIKNLPVLFANKRIEAIFSYRR